MPTNRHPAAPLKNPIKPAPRVLFVQPNPRHPPVTVPQLADMLQLELLMGRPKAFLRRLQNALDSAATPPLEKPTLPFPCNSSRLVGQRTRVHQRGDDHA